MTAVSARFAGPADLRERPGIPIRLEGLTRSYGPVVALVRPEALLVTPDPDGGGRVVTRTFSGASTRVLVALPDGVEVRVDLPSAVSGELVPGAAVAVRPADRPLVAPPEPTAGDGRGGHGRVASGASRSTSRAGSQPVPDREHPFCVPACPAQSGPMMTTAQTLPASDVPLEAGACAVCLHPLSAHDAISLRFCRATEAQAATTRGCVCPAK